MADKEIGGVLPDPEDERVASNEDKEIGGVLPKPAGELVSSDTDEEELLPLTDAELQALEADDPAPPLEEIEPEVSEDLPPTPPAGVPNSRSFKKVFWYQVLSGTLYGVYWFFRNYKQFALHKKLDVKPALVALVLYAATGAIITIPNYFETHILVDLACMLTATFIYCWFFYQHFLLISGFLAGLGYKYIYPPKRLVFVLGLAFLFPSLLTLIVGSDTPDHFMGIFLVAMLVCAAISGWVLSKVQKVLNFIWASHQRRSYNRLVVTPVSAGEKVFIAVLYVFGVFAVLAYLSGMILLFSDIGPTLIG